ncbi:hypothetical protein TNCV_813531 [Trichonephila clavipes]|nr:hypothetical protein TNCV_813531 [Trichonephila clavipes]
MDFSRVEKKTFRPPDEINFTCSNLAEIWNKWVYYGKDYYGKLYNLTMKKAAAFLRSAETNRQQLETVTLSFPKVHEIRKDKQNLLKTESTYRRVSKCQSIREQFKNNCPAWGKLCAKYKFQFKVLEVKYVFQIISKKSVKADSQHIKAITEMETPTDKAGGALSAAFQQYNARPHVACQTLNILTGFDIFPWPTNSPVINPIEHLWDLIGRDMNRGQNH